MNQERESAHAELFGTPPEKLPRRPALQSKLNIPARKHPRTPTGDAVIAREKTKLIRELYGPQPEPKTDADQTNEPHPD